MHTDIEGERSSVIIGINENISWGRKLCSMEGRNCRFSFQPECEQADLSDTASLLEGEEIYDISSRSIKLKLKLLQWHTISGPGMKFPW